MAPITTIKLRGDTAANWSANNPILALHEPGLEVDTGIVRFGDGVTRWNSLTGFLVAPPGSVTNASVASTAAIAESKLALASDAAANVASRRTLGTGATQAAAGNDGRLSDTRVPTDGSVTDAKVSASAAIAKSKLAPLAIVDGDVSAISQGKVTGLPAALAGKVGTTGDEMIAGAKTFSSAPVVPSGAFPESAVANLVSDLAGKQATIPAGTYAGALNETAVKTANYTAVPTDFVLVDATAASRTVTLPTAPADKARIGVKMVATSGTNTVTIAAGGSDHFNLPTGPTSLTLSKLNQAMILQYVASTATWTVQADDLPLGAVLGQSLALTGATAATRYAGGTASGAPTTGTFAVGDYVIDQTGSVWVCTVAGTPGTWVRGVSSVNGLTGAVDLSGTYVDTTTAQTVAGAKKFTGDAIFGSGRPWVDVMAFGADPTGVATSTAAFNSAIAAVADGGTVFVPSCAGTGGYRIDVDLLNVPAKGINWLGAGWQTNNLGSGFGHGSWAFGAGAVTGSVIYALNGNGKAALPGASVNRHQSVRGIAIVGPGSGTGWGISSGQPGRIVLDGITIVGTTTIVSTAAAFSAADVTTPGTILSGSGIVPFSGDYPRISSVATPSTAAAWAATTAVALGAVRRPTAVNGRIYQATTAGTTAGSEPTWPTNLGIVADGSVVWTDRGASTAAVITIAANRSVTKGILMVGGGVPGCAGVRYENVLVANFFAGIVNANTNESGVDNLWFTGNDTAWVKAFACNAWDGGHVVVYGGRDGLRWVDCTGAKLNLFVQAVTGDCCTLEGCYGVRVDDGYWENALATSGLLIPSGGYHTFSNCHHGSAVGQTVVIGGVAVAIRDPQPSNVPLTWSSAAVDCVLDDNGAWGGTVTNSASAPDRNVRVRKRNGRTTGLVATAIPVTPNGATNPIGGATNRTVYFRARGELYISKVAMHVGASAGNIAVAVYTSAGGRSGPTTQLASSGSVACPAIGYAEVSMGATILVSEESEFFAFGTSDASMTLQSMGVGTSFQNSVLGVGLCYQEITFPPPSPSATPGTGRLQPVPVLVGVP